MSLTIPVVVEARLWDALLLSEEKIVMNRIDMNEYEEVLNVSEPQTPWCVYIELAVCLEI